METLNFANRLVNISRIGFIYMEVGTGISVGRRTVVLMVDGVELKEWFNNTKEAKERMAYIEKRLGVVKVDEMY